MGCSSTGHVEKIPSDDILESLYKWRIRESAQLKTILELYDMEVHQMISKPYYQKLKTMVKRCIDKKLRSRNFDARHEGIETNALVKKHKVPPPRLPSHPSHEIEVCRRKEVSKAKVTL